jgi:7-carboxy-7-deazaguanine synthase
MELQEVLEKVQEFPTPHVLLTGGEPLLQRGTLPLARALSEQGYEVSIETHGGQEIEPYLEWARIVMDIKTPGSLMFRPRMREQAERLRPGRDELKFVLTSREDYEFARTVTRELRTLKDPQLEILFSCAIPAQGQPGIFQGVSMRNLAEWILEDGLQVRMQTQLHKWIWGKDVQGV